MRRPKKQNGNGLYVRLFGRKCGKENAYLGSLVVRTLTPNQVLKLIRKADDAKIRKGMMMIAARDERAKREEVPR